MLELLAQVLMVASFKFGATSKGFREVEIPVTVVASSALCLLVNQPPVTKDVAFSDIVVTPEGYFLSSLLD